MSLGKLVPLWASLPSSLGLGLEPGGSPVSVLRGATAAMGKRRDRSIVRMRTTEKRLTLQRATSKNGQWGSTTSEELALGPQDCSSTMKPFPAVPHLCPWYFLSSGARLLLPYQVSTVGVPFPADDQAHCLFSWPHRLLVPVSLELLQGPQGWPAGSARRVQRSHGEPPIPTSLAGRLAAAVQLLSQAERDGSRCQLWGHHRPG